MKKNNNKSSQHKAKRYAKNKKRLKDKPYLSKHERKLIVKRQEIVSSGLRLISN
jgi:hypothetical protein